jgi:meso-butanediol dehydrogenase/(S,S)-butanediol dehydrogenase/diacetyl reductase
MDLQRFAGKVVVVTGAASGIGAATARRFAAEGAKLGLVDIDQDALERAADDLRGSGNDVVGCHADVSEETDVARSVATVADQFGRIDVLVNNAGISAFGSVTDLPTEQWRRVMAVDVDSVFFGSKYALPHLRVVSGSIINVCSVSGMSADYGLASYNTAKGAVLNLTRNLAIDNAPSVRVNSVCPSGVATPRFRRNFDAHLDEYLSRVPMARMAEPEEIAAAIAFLASEDASFITGQNLAIDGGLSAGTGQPDYRKWWHKSTEPR